MCEREDSDEERAAGLTVHGEDVNTETVNQSSSQPDEESFPTGNPHYDGAGASLMARPIATPSSVTSLPAVQAAVWYPSPSPRSAVGMGINMRMQNSSSCCVPLLVVQRGLSLRPETPSTPSDCFTAAHGKKDSSEEACELCTAFDSTSLDTSEPLNPCVRGETEEGAKLLTDVKGIAIQSSGYPNNCDTTGSEEKSDAAEDDDDDDDDDDETASANVVLLQESFPRSAGISKELTRSSASAVDLSSVQEDSGDLGAPGLFPPERNAVGFEEDCHGDPGNVKFDNCNPSSCDPSPGIRSSAQFDAGSLNTLGSNLPDLPDSAQLSVAASVEAEPPDTEQSAEDDDLQWATCKICLQRYWKLIFLPCGHGCCQYCYRLLINRRCPFCRKHIIQIKEVLLAYSLEDM